MKYELIVFGGGTSGVAAAYIASKIGIKTLLVEKSDVLGGSITQGLVLPVMKVNSCSINTDFYNDLLTFANKFSANHTYSDGNTGWFNHEILKIVFDKMLKSVNCDVLFSSYPAEVSLSFKDGFFNTTINHKLLSLYIETKYIIDATSNGEIFKILNCDFQNTDENNQSPSLRFIIGNVNTKNFADWILNIDSDRNVTSVEYTEDQVYLSTACTWEKGKNWALTPMFKKAIADGILEYEDTAYFQLFSIPAMPDCLAVNAPRIILEVLGVRESYRIKGLYTFTKDDIINPKEFDNVAFACDYPIDIHSNKSDTDRLEYNQKTYYVPIECLISEKYKNLYCAGRIISADFEAQAALRTQMSCFSMGEAAAKDIYKKLKNN